MGLAVARTVPSTPHVASRGRLDEPCEQLPRHGISHHRPWGL